MALRLFSIMVRWVFCSSTLEISSKRKGRLPLIRIAVLEISEREKLLRKSPVVAKNRLPSPKGENTLTPSPTPINRSMLQLLTKFCHLGIQQHWISSTLQYIRQDNHLPCMLLLLCKKIKATDREPTSDCRRR